MMLKIACPCGHVGLANAESLPRSLTVLGVPGEPPRRSAARITNKVAFQEWLLGEHKAPLGSASATGAASAAPFHHLA